MSDSAELEMKILEVERQDFEEIHHVWEESVRATHTFLSEEDIEFLKPLVKSQALPSVELHCVKENSGRISGFIGTSNHEVEMLFVSPECIGQGIGTELMRFAINIKNCRKVDVNEQNPRALEFYRKLGFEVTGRSPLDGQGKPFPILHLRLLPLAIKSLKSKADALPYY